MLVGSAFGGTLEDPGGGFIKFAVKRASKQDQTLDIEAPQAGGPINLKFLAHYDYLVSLESSGYREFKNVILRVIFSSATTRVTRKYKKGTKMRRFWRF